MVASDFDNTPITVVILPGEENAVVSIPITNDRIVEGPETIDVVLIPGGDDVTIGIPGQAELTIVDYADSESSKVTVQIVLYMIATVVTVMFEIPEYSDYSGPSDIKVFDHELLLIGLAVFLHHRCFCLAF